MLNAFHLAIFLPRIHLTDIVAIGIKYTRVFFAALFVTAKDPKKPKFPSIRDLINKLQHNSKS